MDNIILGVCDNFYLPFNKNSFDLVSCFLSKYDVGEVSRVLKPGGIFIVETLGANDKKEIKKAFGKDKLGWRGKMLNDTTPEKIARLQKEFLPFFDIKKVYIIKYRTKIKIEMLLELFNMTNDIRNFNKHSDSQKIHSFVDNDNNIEFNEERIIIIAKRKYLHKKH